MQQANPQPSYKRIPNASGQNAINAINQEGGISSNPTHTKNTHYTPLTSPQLGYQRSIHWNSTYTKKTWLRTPMFHWMGTKYNDWLYSLPVSRPKMVWPNMVGSKILGIPAQDRRQQLMAIVVSRTINTNSTTTRNKTSATPPPAKSKSNPEQLNQFHHHIHPLPEISKEDDESPKKYPQSEEGAWGEIIPRLNWTPMEIWEMETSFWTAHKGGMHHRVQRPYRWITSWKNFMAPNAKKLSRRNVM